MELRNVALYCKYWYAHPTSSKDHWKYLSVAIANDGWVIRENKREVVRWIIARFDENPEWFKASCNSFGIGWMFDEIRKQKQWDEWSIHPEGIDDDDAIILAFMSLVMNQSTDMFADKYYPDPRIMPINLAGPEIKEGEYWEPAELMSEWKERVYSKFPDHLEQTDKPYWTIESFEEFLKNKGRW